MKVWMMQGIQGAGKSTWAKTFKATSTGTHICSADDFFINDQGEYVYKKELQSTAHKYCKRQFTNLMVLGNQSMVICSNIIIDNTNTNVRDINYYYDLAMLYDCDFEIIYLKALDIEKTGARNAHKVPIDTIRRFVTNLETFEATYPKDLWKRTVIDVVL
jgi:predicted kinase